jgi:membrane protein
MGSFWRKALAVASSKDNGLIGLSIEAFHRLFADEAVPLAGNIAFRTVFSVFPFLIFLTTLAGFFGNADLAEKLVNWLLSVAPANIVNPIAPEIRSILTVPRTGLLSVSALLTIWSAMGGVDSLRVGLNRAYNIRETRNFYWLYLQSVLFIIAAAAVLLLLAVLIVLAPVMISFLRVHAPGLQGVSDLFDALRLPIAILVLMAGLTAAHKILPARRPSFRELWPGVLLTMLVWIALSLIYSRWLADFSTFASTYSGLSGVFAAMFFLYLAALVFIFGGEVNRVLAAHREAKGG